ncbi:unnamed protein product [Polarella glacialis]|uniref:polynucleotide adenylyltransferase n=1 Tax=Polarella glacialis TaxID=89957 RepID=A0A813JFF4_POLGL|nr:unnamed protein product [Polarella glacialis]
MRLLEISRETPPFASSRTPSRTLSPLPMKVSDSIPHNEVLKFHNECANVHCTSIEKETDETDWTPPRLDRGHGLPSLQRGWRTPDPSPTRRGLPKCASRSFIVDCSDNEDDESINALCVHADEPEPAWARIRTPSPGEDRSSSHRLMLLATQSASEMHTPFFLQLCLPCASPAWADLADKHDGNDVHDDDETPTTTGPGCGSDKGEMCLVSTGSLGHPYTCAEACKYFLKARGCKDGAACDRCHLCEWKRYGRNPSAEEPSLSKWTGGSGGQRGTTPGRPPPQGPNKFPVRGGFLTGFPTTVWPDEQARRGEVQGIRGERRLERFDLVKQAHGEFRVDYSGQVKEPTEFDLALSEKMREDLESVFPQETAEGMVQRKEVLVVLETMFHDWMSKLSAEGGISEEEIRRSTVKITTLGSYRLGVVHPGSDIDTLCIAPPNVPREEFFATFAELLEKRVGDSSVSHDNIKTMPSCCQDDVTECVPIPDAYTPIIKLKMRGVCIDLLFARLAKDIGETEEAEEVFRSTGLNATATFDGAAASEVTCARDVSMLILQLVPNQETFRATLRFVKYWARRRGIYSNILGFFGGITWSLLVARICQLYPYYAPNQLVNRFFRLYHQWNWTRPVMLCEIIDPANVPGMTSFKVWNPKANPADRQHVMPVITPAFPSMNSTYNVTETTKRILLDEFKRGYEVVRDVEAQKATWGDVHKPFPFFTHFSHFLLLEVLSKSEEVYNKFSGWVESKLRILVMQLEAQLEAVNGCFIHPNPVQYDLYGSDPEWPYGCGMFTALSFSKEDGAPAT